MKKTEVMCSNNPLNRITFDGQNYKGAIYYNGVEFSFTLNYQKSGKYVMRGVVSAISPVTGYPIRRETAKRGRNKGSCFYKKEKR